MRIPPYRSGLSLVESANTLLEESPRLGWTAVSARRPSQARRLDRAEARSSSCVAISRPFRPRAGAGVRPARSGSFPPSRPRRAASPRSRRRWPPVWSPPGARSTSCAAGRSRSWRTPWCSRHSPRARRTTSRSRVDALNRTDVAMIQHEYGLYGGDDGDDVLSVMAGLTVPCIVVAHTVVRDPTANQRVVLEQVCDAADAVVVMTTTARNRLIEDFDVEPSKVRVIPHGATTPAGTAWARPTRRTSPARGVQRLASAHLGPARTGQGHRVGDRRRRQPRRRAPAPELRRRRRDPSQGPRALGRVVPRDADPSGLELGRRAVRHVRRHVPRASRTSRD